MNIIHSNTGTVFRAHSRDSLPLYSVEAAPLAVSPTITSETNGDARLAKNTATGARPGFSFFVDLPVEDFAVETTTPDLVDQIGNTFTAKDGATGRAGVVIRNRKGASAAEGFSVNLLGASVTFDLIGFSEGTIGHGGFALVESRLAEGGDAEYYNGSTYAQCTAKEGGIQRNPNCWGAALDFSGMAVSYLWGGFWGGGCLITRRHYVASNHYARANKVGSTMRFVGASGQVYSRTILAQTAGHDDTSSIGNPIYEIGDMVVFLLSSALPEDVAAYPVCGDWIRSAALQTENDNGTADYEVEWTYPIITTDQNRKVLFSTCNRILGGYRKPNPIGTIEIDGETVARPIVTGAAMKRGAFYRQYPEYYAAAIVGDSGSVWFLPLADGSLAAFSHYTTPNDGPLYNAGILNALILEVDKQAGISTGLTVTVAPDPTASP
jgi:hypothetical protein